MIDSVSSDKRNWEQKSESIMCAWLWTNTTAEGEVFKWEHEIIRERKLQNKASKQTDTKKTRK